MSKNIFDEHGVIITRFSGGEKSGRCYQVNFESADKDSAYVLYREKEFWELIDSLSKLKEEREIE